MSEDVYKYLGDENTTVMLKLYILLYADDTVIMTETPSEMQASLQVMHDYCQTWDLLLNISKSKVVVFSRGKIRNKPVFTYGDGELEIVDCFSYLGSTFNYNGTFRKAIVNQAKQGRKAMYRLLSKAAKLNLPPDLTIRLFNSLVTPVLLYGSEIWGYENTQILERVQLQLCKQILHVHKTTPNCIVYGEFGRLSMRCMIEKRMVNYWCRIMSGKEGKLASILYNLSKNYA